MFEMASLVLNAEPWRTLTYCFLRLNKVNNGTFDLLTRYETALWRQAAQLLFMLRSAARR